MRSGERLSRVLGAWLPIGILVWSLVDIVDRILFGASIMHSVGEFLWSPKGDLALAFLAVAILLIVIFWPDIRRKIPKFAFLKDKRLDELEDRIALVETILNPFHSQEEVKEYKEKVDKLFKNLK